MSEAITVWISKRSLSLQQPGKPVWHEPNARDWDRTHCGRPLAYEDGTLGYVTVRLDTARLIGRPCPRCYVVQR